ncbi:DNA polymerase IV [Deferribacter autotrophicus]|uniref:DNA polymerase IV n=1 Tax=Deferribacter autotrophicus TaxID=500465 RepID=A0A5A8F522_9BACT|nr:DNA polymerase IV [Deferribacter autotrophicus]KAA0256918.1 DNA polymerase IV [Deferribacter autotrophicus]
MILCIDMDAFFASVEQASNPNLRGKPIAIIGAKERTVVTTASYEARKYGVKTGMTKYEAMKMCPHITFIVGNNPKYTYISKQIHNFLLTITYDVEMYSVDEAFLDISQVKMPPEDIASLIKNYIKKNFGITCSIGVGKNKLIAKMASGVNKPDGYLFVPPEKSTSFIDQFQLYDIWGIGRRLSKKFANMGIFTPKDLRKLGLTNLVKMFGKNGYKLFAMAHGDYIGNINVEEEPVKSIGHSMTLPHDIYSEKEALPYLLQLCEMVSARARKNRVSGKTISIYLRDIHMNTFGKRHTLPFLTCATHHIFEVAKLLLKEYDLSIGIRLLGVSLSNLVHNSVHLTTIMESNKKEKIYKAIDEINSRYGDFTISYAAILKCKRKGSLTISPAWKPSGIRNINVK